MQSVLPAEVILAPATQLETTYSEYREQSLQVRNGVEIDFKKLDEFIEHPNVQRLQFSTAQPILLEIKKMFEVILSMDRSVMDGWKYKNTFLNVEISHYDKYEAKKVQFVAMNWIDSFVTSFIMHLYH
jgi:hypothetical protein